MNSPVPRRMFLNSQLKKGHFKPVQSLSSFILTPVPKPLVQLNSTPFAETRPKNQNKLSNTYNSMQKRPEITKQDKLNFAISLMVKRNNQYQLQSDLTEKIIQQYQQQDQIDDSIKLEDFAQLFCEKHPKTQLKFIQRALDLTGSNSISEYQYTQFVSILTSLPITQQKVQLIKLQREFHYLDKNLVQKAVNLALDDEKQLSNENYQFLKLILSHYEYQFIASKLAVIKLQTQYNDVVISRIRDLVYSYNKLQITNFQYNEIITLLNSENSTK